MPKTLTPEQAQWEIDLWMLRHDDDAADAYYSRMRRIRLSDGSWVTYDGEPGWLRIDGERVYSTAWL